VLYINERRMFLIFPNDLYHPDVPSEMNSFRSLYIMVEVHSYLSKYDSIDENGVSEKYSLPIFV